jgi:hypothetical protein
MAKIPDSLNNTAAPHAHNISAQTSTTSQSSAYNEDCRCLPCRLRTDEAPPHRYLDRLVIARRLLREASAPNRLHTKPPPHQPNSRRGVRSFLSCITGQRRHKRNRSHLCLTVTFLQKGSASKEPWTAAETELSLRTRITWYK